MFGRLIVLVGGVGVGKDALIAALAEKHPDIEPVRRVITRPVEDKREQHISVGHDIFRQGMAYNSFCMTWQSWGEMFGLPSTMKDKLAAGQDMVTVISRVMLADAKKQFRNTVIFNITASKENVRARSEERGLEVPEIFEERLARPDSEISPGVQVINVPNDGSIEDALAIIEDHLQLEKA